MKQEELDRILELHKKWLNNEGDGVRADLRDADLTGADLSYADLSGADLRDANLIGVDLTFSNLRDADLRYADLIGADLMDADLRYADLIGADLMDVDLRYANLTGATLRGADLRLADLSCADLTGADFRNCIGNGKEIKSLQIGTYLISYTKDILNIGCKSYTLEQWKNFTNDEIAKMDRGALEWWNMNKHIIIELVERESKR